MINDGTQTNQGTYTTTSDFVSFIQQDIEDALNNLYDL